MNKIFLTLAMLIIPSMAMGEDIVAYGVNIKSLVDNTRAGVFVPFKGGKSLTTIYTPVVSLHSASGVEYMSLDLGAGAYKGNFSSGYGLASLGFRLDNILDRTIGISSWVKSHVSHATLPTLEFGGGAVLVDKKLLTGANIAIKF